MKRTILCALAATLITTTVAAQAVMRPRPGAITKATPQAPIRTQIQALSPQALAARLRSPVAFASQQMLKAAMPQLPNMTGAPFTLTPLNRTIENAGILEIDGQISSPMPPPAGWPGQAIIRRTAGLRGYALLQIYSKSEISYAVDCLTTVSHGKVNVDISGTTSDIIGKMEPVNGHLYLTLRGRPDNYGKIYVYLFPDVLVQEANNPLQPTLITEKNIMDFWGCQITPSG
jgi:hypothetical protein